MIERICVLGNTIDDAVRLLDILCQDNEDIIYRRRRSVGIMNDGTELIAMSIENKDSFIAYVFDYVFYEKNRLGSYCSDYGASIEYIQKSCMMHSRVPAEFQWCAVDT